MGNGVSSSSRARAWSRPGPGLDLAPNPPRGPSDIDAMVGVDGMAADRLVLLVPLCERLEVERDVAGEGVVGEPEAGAVGDRDRLPRRGVDGERDPGVQPAGHVAVRGRRRAQLAAMSSAGTA